MGPTWVKKWPFWAQIWYANKWIFLKNTIFKFTLIAPKWLFGVNNPSGKKPERNTIKKIHYGKIEIFWTLTEATDQMLPRKAPNDPKTLPMGILHDYKSCWTTLRPFGLKHTLTGRKASEHPRGAGFGPNCRRLV